MFLTVHETDEKMFAALRAGAKGYMLKSIASTDLLSSLRAVVRGERAISRKMMSSILDEFSNPTTSDMGKEKLLLKISPREVDVLREVESGATNLEIAQRLLMSENTVKHHLRNILDKLEVENRREAALFARQNGLISKFSNNGEGAT